MLAQSELDKRKRRGGGGEEGEVGEGEGSGEGRGEDAEAPRLVRLDLPLTEEAWAARGIGGTGSLSSREEKEEEEEEENEDEANEDETVLTPSPLFLESCFFSSSPLVSGSLGLFLCIAPYWKSGIPSTRSSYLAVTLSVPGCRTVHASVAHLKPCCSRVQSWHYCCVLLVPQQSQVHFPGSSHRKEQCRGRAARSNIGIVRVVRERPRLRDEASAGPPMQQPPNKL